MADKTPVKKDMRGRLGWCADLDGEPQSISEKRRSPNDVPVVVIPIPYNSAVIRTKVREFVKSLFPE